MNKQELSPEDLTRRNIDILRNKDGLRTLLQKAEAKGQKELSDALDVINALYASKIV